MTLARLVEIIEEMRRELRTIDECILALEIVATGRRKRGRPRKRLWPTEKVRSETNRR